MHHGRRLQEDRDFVLLERGAHVSTPVGIRWTDKVWQVYLLTPDMETDGVEAFLCPVCQEYSHEKARGIVGHWKVHSPTAKPSRANDKRDAAAFRLLPARVRKVGLQRLAEQEKAGEPTGGADAEV